MADYAAKYEALKRRNGERDERMRQLALVRSGKADQVFQGLLPDRKWNKPIIANMIDVVARDFAEQAGVLPTITATGDSALDESNRTKADKRTKIANYYLASSSLGTEQPKFADLYASYGFAVYRVEPNFTERRPQILVENSMGSYYDRDRFGRVLCYAKRFMRRAGDLAARFPEYATTILKGGAMGADDQMLEVVLWYDKDNTVMFIPARSGLVLTSLPNKIGRVPVAIAERPTFDGEVRGQFDDVLPVYAAKARLALLMLQAVQKSVEAPLALPQDVTKLPVGPDAVIRSNTPEKIRRVPLDIPQYAFAENNLLSDELKLGTRFPEARAGQVDGSIVTGQGVKALMAGFDSQVKTAQSVIGEALGEALSLAFATDEAYFGAYEREVSASANGVHYKLKYRPAKDIAGAHAVSVEYGLMAGLDPNRALVFALQARGDKLLSRNMVRRNLPVTINAAEEERAIDVEEMRDSLKAAVSSLSAAIPQMVAQGQDPMKIIDSLSTVIDERKKGTPLEAAVKKAFTPPKPKATPAAPEMPGAAPAAPEAAAPQSDVQMPDQGPPPMQQLLAGLTGSGNPNLSSRVVRQIPA